ncbi:glycosyltransferase family 2 protein [Candidatus Pacearchaeota archaeon]|nr:glycosyltransferase family 2 protein [Candidatus Pacearchaeota archaeon]
MRQHYSLKDISVVIATYNRSQDLKETLASFKSKLSLIKEVLIIDQSTDLKTKEMIAKIKNKKIRYIHTDIPSLTKARNCGVRKVSKETKFICFLDDDVTLGKEYFEKILEVFNNEPSAQGVSGYYLPKELQKNSFFENTLKKLFAIECFEENRARVLSAYGATYPSKLTKIINTQWLSGFNMTFKKEIGTEFSFDEKLTRYALGEDFDFTYRVFKKYPLGLFLTPHATLVHRASLVERMPTEKLAYMNQINHFYFNYKNFNSSLKEKLTFMWCIGGISFLRFALYLKTRKENERLKWVYCMRSLKHARAHTEKIANGQLSSLYLQEK